MKKVALSDTAYLMLRDMITGWLEDILDDPVIECVQFEQVDQAARELGFGGAWDLIEEDGLGTDIERSRLKKHLNERKQYVNDQRRTRHE